jgi:hypothetical protein
MSISGFRLRRGRVSRWWVDNATLPSAGEALFVKTLDETPGFSRVLLLLGNGELVILKEQA